MTKRELYQVLRTSNDINKTEKLIYMYLALGSSGKGATWVKYEEIMQGCNITSRTTISNTLKTLQEKKYIRIYKNRNTTNGYHATSTYFIIPRITDA